MDYRVLRRSVHPLDSESFCPLSFSNLTQSSPSCCCPQTSLAISQPSRRSSGMSRERAAGVPAANASAEILRSVFAQDGLVEERQAIVCWLRAFGSRAGVGSQRAEIPKSFCCRSCVDDRGPLHVRGTAPHRASDSSGRWLHALPRRRSHGPGGDALFNRGVRPMKRCAGTRRFVARALRFLL